MLKWVATHTLVAVNTPGGPPKKELCVRNAALFHRITMTTTFTCQSHNDHDDVFQVNRCF
jgi:hypothetical protein